MTDIGFNSPEEIKAYMEWLDKHRHFYIDQVREWLNLYDKEEISLSKFVELLNREVFRKDQSPDNQEQEEKDNFAISFCVWALHDLQAKAYLEAGITAYGLLEKYKDRPFLDTTGNKN